MQWSISKNFFYDKTRYSGRFKKNYMVKQNTVVDLKKKTYYIVKQNTVVDFKKLFL